MGRMPSTNAALLMVTRILKCSDCHEEFVHTVASQQYFAAQGYKRDPTRCRSCHTRFKRVQGEQPYHSPSQPSS